MDRERWQRITDLFDAAMERSASERARFLSEACAGDLAMLDEVQTLLAAHDRDPEFLEDSGDLLLDAALAAGDGARGTDSATQERAGDWVLRQRLGAGRAGTVYLAERHDDPAQRAVVRLLDGTVAGRAMPVLPGIAAVGVGPPGSFTPPTIARWLEGGVTAEGVPYFVSPFVEGQRIDVYCAQRQPTLRERLGLCVAACDALQMAHQLLVVHGGLGPGEVLVADTGTVTVVDFGLAALAAGARAAAPPAGGGRIEPLPYAESSSPEQIRGEPTTTACDIYALGVLLYGLLAGVPPFVFATRSAAEVERLARQGVAARPSEAAPAHRRELAGALDAIVMTAMQRDPARRYPTVHALGDELRRYLQGSAVLAYRERRSERARRWGRRHPWAMAAAAAASLLLLGVVAWTGYGAASARAQRRRAAVELQRARQQAQSIADLLVATAPAGSLGDTLTVRTMLQLGERAADELATDPQRQALRWQLLAELHEARGDRARAAALLRKVLAFQEASYGPGAAQALRTRGALERLEAVGPRSR